MSLSTLGGRKFLLGVVSILAVVLIVQIEGDAAATTAVTLIYGAYCGGNVLVEKAHAGKGGGTDAGVR